MSIHDGLNHQCSVCGHTSKSRDALRKHLAYRHLIGMSGPVRPRMPATKRRGNGLSVNGEEEELDGQEIDPSGSRPPDTSSESCWWSPLHSSLNDYVVHPVEVENFPPPRQFSYIIMPFLHPQKKQGLHFFSFPVKFVWQISVIPSLFWSNLWLINCFLVFVDWLYKKKPIPEENS